jgi:hypothetical protein
MGGRASTCYMRGDGFEGYARTTPSASLCKFGPFEGHAFEGYPHALNGTVQATRSSATLVLCVAPPAVGLLPSSVALRLSLNGIEFAPGAHADPREMPFYQYADDLEVLLMTTDDH